MPEKIIQSELKTRHYMDEDIVQTLQKQVLIMPELINKDSEYQLVRGDVSDINKVLAQAGYQTEIVLDKNLKRRALVQKDASIILPLILFASNIPINIATGFIANWLSIRFPQGHQTDIKYEHARFGPDGKIVDYVKFEGKSEEVVEILKSGKFQSIGHKPVIRTVKKKVSKSHGN